MKVINRRARYDYEILESFETGIVLTGPEVKSLRGGRMTLDGSFVKIIGSEVYLVNAQIFPYPYARPENYDPKRTRKLLMHKKEIISLKIKLASTDLTLVPLECYNSKAYFKVKIALAKGKKKYQNSVETLRVEQELHLVPSLTLQFCHHCRQLFFDWFY